MLELGLLSPLFHGFLPSAGSRSRLLTGITNRGDLLPWPYACNSAVEVFLPHHLLEAGSNEIGEGSLLPNLELFVVREAKLDAVITILQARLASRHHSNIAEFGFTGPFEHVWNLSAEQREAVEKLFAAELQLPRGKAIPLDLRSFELANFVSESGTNRASSLAFALHEGGHSIAPLRNLFSRMSSHSLVPNYPGELSGALSGRHKELTHHVLRGVIPPPFRRFHSQR
ncbi:hypothetical protein B0H14DRAFT_2572598 [Mycena olivaceomarginata]|nr:hypothetical protein B0H14DRAFT_2572598 [Mycena olivaceomarginata]